MEEAFESMGWISKSADVLDVHEPKIELAQSREDEPKTFHLRRCELIGNER